MTVTVEVMCHPIAVNTGWTRKLCLWPTLVVVAKFVLLILCVPGRVYDIFLLRRLSLTQVVLLLE